MTRRALTTDGGYRSPIFLPNSSTVLALRGNAIVRLGSTGGNTPPLRMKVGVAKLVGVDSDDPSAVVVLLDDAKGRVTAGVRVAPGRYGDRAAVRRR